MTHHNLVTDIKNDVSTLTNDVDGGGDNKDKNKDKDKNKHALPYTILVVIVGYVSVLLLLHYAATPLLEKINCVRGNFSGQADNVCSILRKVYTYFSLIISLLEILLTVCALASILHITGMNGSAIAAATGVGSLLIGFGCQSYIKDIFNGVMFLTENQATVGDQVRITLLTGATENSVTGTIYAFTARILTLRTLDGGLLFIPNGNIATIRNLSKQPEIITATCGINTSTKPEDVFVSLQPVIHQLNSDALISRFFVSPPIITGIVPSPNLNSTDSYGVEIVATIKSGTKKQVSPHLNYKLQQWAETNGYTCTL